MRSDGRVFGYARLQSTSPRSKRGVARGCATDVRTSTTDSNYAREPDSAESPRGAQSGDYRACRNHVVSADITRRRGRLAGHRTPSARGSAAGFESSPATAGREQHPVTGSRWPAPRLPGETGPDLPRESPELRRTGPPRAASCSPREAGPRRGGSRGRAPAQPPAARFAAGFGRRLRSGRGTAGRRAAAPTRN